MKLPKFGLDESLFSEQSVKMGARIYAGALDTSPKVVNQQEFDFVLTEPSYDSYKDIQADETATITQRLTEEYFFIEDTSSLGGEVGSFGEQSI